MTTSTYRDLLQFEAALQKPNGDPTGFAGFFNSGDIWVARAPARLDVMGGIADYSGANVCEAVLDRGMLMALQPRTDETLRIRSVQLGQRGLPVETRIPLSYFYEGDTLGSYSQVKELCRSNPLLNWVAYIGGSIFTLLKEEAVRMPYGFSMLLMSSVPMNIGVGSSAAVEIGTLSLVNSYLGLGLSPMRIARLGQMAENHVVGAPCGVMDQIAISCGREGKLSHILCRPGSIEGEVEIPAGTSFVGINSMVRHSVGGTPYTDTRIGAFMGKRIINALRAERGSSPIGYLCDLTVSEFEKDFLPFLPESIRGEDFISQYRTHDDPVTVIQPDAVYRVAGPTSHPVSENERVMTFMQGLRAKDESGYITAGEMMYAAHESYKTNCNLSVPEVDFLVEAVRSRGASAGLYGAKITGGGTGGTVAVFGREDSLKEHIPQIALEYSRLIGSMPDVFEGTSPGAGEFGCKKYSFSATGWESTLI